MVSDYLSTILLDFLEFIEFSLFVTSTAFQRYRTWNEMNSCEKEKQPAFEKFRQGI